MKQNTNILTILTTKKSRRLTKIFSRNAAGTIDKSDYQKAMYFTAKKILVADIFELSQVLLDLESRKDTCVIRGDLRAGQDPVHVNRRMHAKESEEPSFQMCSGGKRWICLDFDKVAYDGNALEDLQKASSYLVSLLPPEFQDVTHHVQWSSSSFVTDTTRLSAHIWFFLTDPVDDRSLRDWAKTLNGLVDAAVFGSVQPIYTASPIFQNVPDPLGNQRSYLVLAPKTTVSLQRPKPPRNAVPRRRSTQGSQDLQTRLAKIGGSDGFHEPIRDVIAWYVSKWPDRGDYEDLKDRIRKYILKAARDRPEKDLSRYLSDRYLDDSIQGANNLVHKQHPLKQRLTPMETYEDRLRKYRNDKQFNKRY